MNLASFTLPRLIVPELGGRTAPEAIGELSQMLYREERIPDLASFYHAAMSRECLTGTDMEAEMAFPHARLPMLKTLTFAFGRSSKPMCWGAKASGSVRMVFLMAVPEDDSMQYLQLISCLARLGSDPASVQAILRANDPNQIMEVFQRVPLHGAMASKDHHHAVLA